MGLEPLALVRTCRRFRQVGPVYKVVEVGKNLANGRSSMLIRVSESGEQADYRLTDTLQDQREH